MIEVEKNFDLRAGDKERLIHGAHFLGSISFTDVYYDSLDYRLTGRDFWLRSRDGKFELKVPMNERISERISDRYREFETEEEIRAELGLHGDAAFPEVLAESGYHPFATIRTAREKYKKDGFNLDFDEMDFGFSTFEVELMVEYPEEIKKAEGRITEFARSHGIGEGKGRGKVIEYLARHNPVHFEALRERGVVA